MLELESEQLEKLEHLCLEMGWCLWHIQGAEQMLAKNYAIVFRVSENPTEEKIDEEFEKHFSLNAGRLIGLHKAGANIEATLANRLEEFVSERNWLVHKLRRMELHKLFASENEYGSVIERVQALSQEANNLTTEFHDATRRYFLSRGVPPEVLDRQLKNEGDRIMGKIG